MESDELPYQISLHQNYPNPFNPTTSITFELDKPAQVKLTVFDALGRTVQTLVNENKPTGSHTVSFDAASLSSGMYIYRLESETHIQTRKMVLIK